MRAKTINEYNFQKTGDVKRSLNIGEQNIQDQMQGMKALFLFLYNSDHNFIDQVWGDEGWMKKHLEDKLAGKCKAEGFKSPNALASFISDLDEGKRADLFRYIAERHKS